MVGSKIIKVCMRSQLIHLKKKKKEITRTNFWIKVNSLLSVLYSLSFIHIFCPISADLDDLPSPEFPLLKKRTRQNTGGRLAQLLGATNKTCKICQLPQFPHTIKEKKWAFPLSTFLDQMQPNCVLFEMPRASPNFACYDVAQTNRHGPYQCSDSMLGNKKEPRQSIQYWQLSAQNSLLLESPRQVLVQAHKTGLFIYIEQENSKYSRISQRRCNVF